VTALLVALACAAALFVLAPLRRPLAPPAGEAEREALLRARDTAYQTLRDIELDHDTGKLGDADYAAFRARYRAEAVKALRRLDAPATDMPAASPAAPAAGVAPASGAADAGAGPGRGDAGVPT